MKRQKILISAENAWNVLERIRFRVGGEYMIINDKKYIVAELSGKQIIALSKSEIPMDIFIDDRLNA